MDIQELQDYQAPNGTKNKVTLYKSSTGDTLCFKNERGIIIPVGSGGGNVNKNVTATGTTAANTKTTLTYGVNVFTTITGTAYAAKLPTPVTGQSVVVVNNTGSSLKLYPSMPGGKINGVVDGVATVPPDGKAYTFYCIENPLPGEWTWDALAVGQYDSGIISISVTSGTGTGGFNPVVSAYDNNIKTVIPNYANNSAGYDGKNLPTVQGYLNSGYPIYFRPDIAWSTITKIKVYTNATIASSFALVGNGEIDYYDINTSTLITNGPSTGGSFASDRTTDNTIPGSLLTPGDVIQPYVGAPGTLWGEYTFSSNIMNNLLPPPDQLYSSVIGNKDYGNVIFPYSGNPYTGQLVNAFYSSYITFQIQPMEYNNYGTKTFAFRFIIEHT